MIKAKAMKSQVKMKKCKAAGCENMFTPSFSTLQKYCSAQCTYNEKNKKASKPRTKIPLISKKRKKETPKYRIRRLNFLSQPENLVCKIQGTNCTHKSTTIEHTKGRKGFADDWARENGVSLYLDERFWVGACNNCNLELENNPELSKQHQLSKIHDGKKI